MKFETKSIAAAPDTIAPDGSEVRVLCQLSRGGLAVFSLPPRGVSKAVAHHTVEEVWYVISGHGRIWRKLDSYEEIVELCPGLSLTIPTGTHFQFRCDGVEPLAVIGATMPPWPGEGEAYGVQGLWEATTQPKLKDPVAMKNTAARHTGRHFLQIPGPTNVPERVLQAIAMPTIDHRGHEFAALGQEVVAGMKRVFQTDETVVVYPSSGTGAWEAALSNTLSPGDQVIMFETGQFATLWHQMATRLGLDVEFVPGDWRHGVDPAVVEEKLAGDREHRLKAVCVVHNETSTGVASRIAEIRDAIDRARHPALFMVDTISSLASIEYRHDAWKVDVTVGGSQKGLMLPPGLGFNAVSKKALAAHKTARLPRSYWDWEAMLETGRTGFFPYTPATNLLYGLRESLKMLLDEEGLAAVFHRHARHAEATRRAVAAWGLEVLCADPREHSNSLTAVLVPNGFDADRLREIILEAFDMSLGTGLGKLRSKVFRIGHLGHFNDLMLCGTLSGVEMGLHRAGIPHRTGGVTAALQYLGSVLSEVVPAA